MFIGYVSAQKTNITDAAVLMKKYNPRGGEKSVKLVNEAKDFIDKAAVHPETSESMKMHYYRGMIYFALVEMATVEAMMGKVPDQDLMEKNAEIAKESLIKVVNDTDKRKGYQEDAKSFIGIRVNTKFKQGLDLFEEKSYLMAALSFIQAYEIGKFIQNEDESAKTNSILSILNYSKEIMNKPDSLADPNNLKMAEEFLIQAIEIFPKEYDLQVQLVDLAIKQGKTDMAIKELNKAILIQPENASLYGFLADEYLKLGNMEKAEEYYLKSIEIDSSYANGYILLGGHYVNWAGDLQSESNKIDYRDPRADELSAKAKELQIKAIPYLEIAALELPDNAEIARALAECFKRKGDEENFQKWYNQYQKLKN